MVFWKVFIINWKTVDGKMYPKNWYGRETHSSENIINKEIPGVPARLPGIPERARMLIILEYFKGKN
jgi:hypothetical protein